MSNVETDKGDLQKQLTFGMASDSVVQPFIISALEEANGGPPARMPQRAEAMIKVDDQGTAHVHTTYDTAVNNALFAADTTVNHSADGKYYTRDAKTGDIYRSEDLAIEMLQPNELIGASTFSYPKTGKNYDDVSLADLSPTDGNSQNLFGSGHDIIRRDGKVLGYVDTKISNTGLLDGTTVISYQVSDTHNKLLGTFRTVEDDQGMQGRIKLERI